MHIKTHTTQMQQIAKSQPNRPEAVEKRHRALEAAIALLLLTIYMISSMGLTTYPTDCTVTEQTMRVSTPIKRPYEGNRVKLYIDFHTDFSLTQTYTLKVYDQRRDSRTDNATLTYAFNTTHPCEVYGWLLGDNLASFRNDHKKSSDTVGAKVIFFFILIVFALLIGCPLAMLVQKDDVDLSAV